MKQYPTDDHEQRQQAIDPNRSFIIQAPAGSGKTELLIQRYLRLLTKVATPSKIVAVTFTKKACGEMRKRLQEALTSVNSTQTLPPHKQLTQKLASDVYQHAKNTHWCIENIPSECTILTIDAVIGKWLALASPHYSMWGQFEVLLEPKNFYRTCVKNFINTYGLADDAPLADHFRKLLRYNHCDQSHLVELLTLALSTREQWLMHVFTHGENGDLEHYLHETINLLIKNTVEQTLSICEEEIIKLMHALRDLYALIPTALHPMIEHHSIYQLPLHHEWDVSHWQTLTAFLFTTQLTLRKKLQTKHGFLSKQHQKSLHENTRTDYLAACDDVYAILGTLTTKPTAIALLQEIHTLPIIRNDEWETLQPLLAILPKLAAYLHMTMVEQRVCDYPAKSIHIQQALHDPNSKLAETLYQQVEHLLIDEFQDTSQSQLAIFSLVISHWEGEQHRTLAIVGDPMQSIYAFRQADVRLFEKVKTQGIAKHQLQALRLAHNYRSNSALVNWNNALFSELTKDKSPYFLPATATKDDPSGKVVFHNNTHSSKEATYICQHIIHTKKTHPHASIAVLVRSRNQLRHIIPTLQEQMIDYEAVGIDSLAKEQALLDALSLYMIAQDLHDRQHWIALLRSPMLGLSWQDIHTLSQPKDSLIWDNMQNYTKLSEDAYHILNRVKPIINHHVLTYKQHDHAIHSLKLWHALGGPWTLANNHLFKHIEYFFHTLSQMQTHHGILNFQEAITLLQQTTITSPANAKNPVTLMTIHKSKGLEFDIVYCVGLEKAAPIEPKPIISCYDTLIQQEQRVLLHTQPKHSSHASSLQKYIHQHIQANRDQEQIRLCYVACTRAKQELHLSYATEKEQVSSRTWLSMMQHQIPQTKVINNVDTKNTENKAKSSYQMRRLPIHWQHPYVKPPEKKHTPVHTESTISLRWGEVIHEYLQWFAGHLDENITYNTIKMRIEYYARCHHVHDTTILQWVTNKLLETHQDKVFNWLFAKHPLHLHEQPLQFNNKPYRLDRCFITKEQQVWIIDFKTYGIENQDKDVPNNTLYKDSYHQQLLLYKNALKLQYPKAQIRTGLYFPLQQVWHEVEHKPTTLYELQ